MVSSGLSQVLKSLVPVKRGDDVHGVASAERINAIQTAIHLLTRGDNIVGGNNIRKKSGDGFVCLSADTRVFESGEQAFTETPFQVVMVPNPDPEALGDLVGVISNSHLFNSEDLDTYEEDNTDWGLLDDDRTADFAFDPGFPGEKIYLQIELDPTDQSIISIDVVHGQVLSADWVQYPDPIEINTDDDPANPYQQYFYQIIAEITDPEQDPRPGIQVKNSLGQTVQVTQLLFANLMMTTARTTTDANEADLPLLVAIPWDVLPGTSIDGNADEIPFEENLMTPWQFTTLNEEIYNFKIEDATDSEGPKVFIFDGEANGDLPDGMGDDDYILPITEWDSEDGEADIVLEMTYDLDGTVTSRSIVAVMPENYPEDQPGNFMAFSLGVVYVEQNVAGEWVVVEVRNTHCGDVDVELAPLQTYAFQMFDNSVEGQACVRIMDGDVIDQDGIGHTPEGMGNDDYILNVEDGYAVWLVIPHDEEWNVIDPVTIDTGAEVPGDTNTIAYVEIAYVEVFYPEGPDESVPQAIPHNTVCGDWALEPPDVFNRYAFEIIDKSDGSGANVLILDGDVLDKEGEGHTPSGMGADNYTIYGIADGTAIWLEIDVNQDYDILSVTIGYGPDVPDDINPDDTNPVGRLFVEIGYVDVAPDDDGTPQVTMIHNTVLGDYALISGVLTITGDSAEGTDVNLPNRDQINFLGAVVIEHDPDDVNPNAVDVTIGLDVTGDDDEGAPVAIDKAVVMNFYQGVAIGLNDDDPDVVAVDVEIGLDVTGDNDEGVRISADKLAVMNFYGGVDIGINDDDPEVNALDVEIGLDVTGDDSAGTPVEVDKVALMNFEGAVSLHPVTHPDYKEVTAKFGEYISDDAGHEVEEAWGIEFEGGATVSQTEPGFAKVKIGEYIADDDGHEVEDAWGMEFFGAATVSQTEPGFARIDIGEYISDDAGHEVENAWGIEFQGAATVSQSEPGFALVNIGEYVSDDEGGYVENCWGMSFPGARVEQTDPGYAVIHTAGTFSVQGTDGSFVDEVTHIQFEVSSDPSAGYINVYEAGAGVAMVVIPIIPTSPGGIAVLGDDNGDTHWFSTSVCP